jgi:sodium transport system ATP-binding protein
MIEVIGLQKAFKVADKDENKKSSDLSERNLKFAVKSVSFSCLAGKVLGLIGPNGAGKTTTLRMLSSSLAPTQGQIKVMGKELLSDKTELRRQIGFLSGHTGLYGRLTAVENLRYFGRAYGMKNDVLEARISTLAEQFGFQSYINTLVDKFSFGMKQRVAIARSVIHSPKILILDEPTTGLDVLGAKLVSDFVLDYKRQGAAVIFSTHHMHEVEMLCDSVCIINSGASVFEGPVIRLLEETGKPTLHDAYLLTILNS